MGASSEKQKGWARTLSAHQIGALFLSSRFGSILEMFSMCIIFDLGGDFIMKSCWTCLV